jgi:hypothetical protein
MSPLLGSLGCAAAQSCEVSAARGVLCERSPPASDLRCRPAPPAAASAGRQSCSSCCRWCRSAALRRLKGDCGSAERAAAAKERPAPAARAAARAGGERIPSPGSDARRACSGSWGDLGRRLAGRLVCAAVNGAACAAVGVRGRHSGAESAAAASALTRTTGGRGASVDASATKSGAAGSRRVLLGASLLPASAAAALLAPELGLWSAKPRTGLRPAGALRTVGESAPPPAASGGLPKSVRGVAMLRVSPSCATAGDCCVAVGVLWRPVRRALASSAVDFLNADRTSRSIEPRGPVACETLSPRTSVHTDRTALLRKAEAHLPCGSAGCACAHRLRRAQCPRERRRAA